jgi:adenosylcobinamide-GDP ribazoletransferase
MMMRQAKLVCTAVQFLTRLPTPQFHDFRPEWLTEAARYFPLVGVLVGALSAAVLIAASQVWPPVVAIILALACATAITGAFHEDGLADFFDSFGGATREARLAIMKDSRIGTFGVLALMVAMALKVGTLLAMPVATAAAALIAAHAGGRLASVAGLALLPYAGRADAAKVRPLSGISDPRHAAIAIVTGLAPLMLLSGPQAIAGLALGCIAGGLIALLAWRLIGGVTGDALGAVEQAFEIGLLLGVAACV